MRTCNKCNLSLATNKFSDYKSRKATICNSCRYKLYTLPNKQKNKKKNVESVLQWREKEHNNLFYVYLLPYENYVGKTKCVKRRISEHTRIGRNTQDYKILHSFSMEKDALEKEIEYHNMGYDG